MVPADWLAWLSGLHVNWVGISVALHYDDSMDSTVERTYPPAPPGNPATFADEELRQFIRDSRAGGLDVYMTLAFESHTALDAARPVARWQLGDPRMPDGVQAEFWPWRPDHPDHERFVAEFFETYTQQAVHFARIAEEEGVGLYSVGTETDRLFRTRSGEGWSNHFRAELQAMMTEVRAVYDGLLTYDMHVDAVREPYLAPGSNCLWADLDLDVVGVSAWFDLVDETPTSLTSVSDLESAFEERFRNQLMPLAKRNPGRPIVFTEFGAVDHVSAPKDLGDSHYEGTPFVHTDDNGNGVDDGRETQANIAQALFNTMDKYPDLVEGVFWWNNWMASDALWDSDWGHLLNFDIRNKPAGEIVRAAYAAYAMAE